MTTKTRPTTADYLLRMPRDGSRCELIRGVLVSMSDAGSRHGRIAGNIYAPLWAHVRANDLGIAYMETGYLLSTNPDTVRFPDGSFVNRERLEREGETDGFRRGAPDLAIEVISPTDRLAAVERKAAEWIAAGARMAVVANPRSHSVKVYTPNAPVAELGEDGVIDGGDVVPGWSVPVSGVFR